MADRSRTYKTDGIILKRTNVGEADRIISVFSKTYGKCHCLAKGVRKPTSRKSASIELFNHATLFVARGKNLDILTQAEVIEDFPRLRNSLRAAKAAYHVVELVELLTAENQESRPIYLALVEMLRRIDAQGLATRRQIIDFEQRLLQELGFGTPPEHSQDALRLFIESIIEKRLKSIEIFKNV